MDTTTSTPAAPQPAPEQLVASWLALWNGDHTRAESLIADGFALHAAMMDGGDGGSVDSAASLVAWIAQTRAAVPDLIFTTQVGPIVDGDHLALRWRAVGTYAGGLPGAGAPVGTRVDFTGTDLLPGASATATMTRTTSGWDIHLDAVGLPRLADGQFYQAWLRNADGVLVPIGTFNEGADVTLWAGVSPELFPTMTITRESADNAQESSGQRVLVGEARPR